MDLSVFDKMALSSFSPVEKQSVYQLLCGAMIVDGNRDPREVALLNEVKQLMCITEADVIASRSLSETTMTNCLHGMAVIKKAYVAKFMAQIILADGVVTEKENLFFDYMHKKLELPEMD